MGLEPTTLRDLVQIRYIMFIIFCMPQQVVAC